MRDDDESENIFSNLLEAKETLDEKMKHSELKIFTEGKTIIASENITAEDEEKIETVLYEKQDSEKLNDDLEEELKQLRNKKFVEIEDESGRVRRKVQFDDDDEYLEHSLDDDSEEDEDDDDKREDIELDITHNLKKGKNDVHDKITSVLKDLESRKNKEQVQDSSEDSSDDEITGDSDDDNDDEVSDEDGNIRWKDSLAEKAQKSFLERQSSNKNLMKLIYGIFDEKHSKDDQEQSTVDTEEGEDIGGLFKKVTRDQQRTKVEKDMMNLTESSLMMSWNAPMDDWLRPDKSDIINCFVTGKWKENEDASELLKLDDAEDLSDVDSEIFGDFEDLEKGEKHEAKPKAAGDNQKRKREENEKDDEADKQALAEKKRKLKEKFDTDYDTSEKTSYYDDLKMSAEKQSQLNKTVFENMPDEVRVQLEGYRPGMYVRIEFENVPCEIVQHFDPTYPLVIGALNMSEENIGFVNVKIKKHRWYSKILKTSDPLIISLGWRRFQTIPLYSKLEDDLKFRYLKYTPEHLACNAHFWGPITPQGTGFLALQVVDSNQEVLKKIGFRIAATGSVQELDKSTQILKKLKLVGHPLKIYKKTAFIKGMFNSSLEVAKFEGSRIKTVSGIRGQIKKAVNKPEGCFRATFEDKILLSDIVFCTTWYKVDPPQFYTPLNTLLLPPNEKNSWKGLRTTGEIKRAQNINNLPNKDSLYTEILREEKPFKPLVIPKKLQKALPYRDKPKHNVQLADKKKSIQRVAVIREPKEQKVAKMMKMIKASYQHKQDKLKQETKERLEKHRQEVAAIEMNKERKLKQKKKEVFRKRSKAQSKNN